MARETEQIWYRIDGKDTPILRDTLEIDLKTTELVLSGYEKSRIILSESGINTPDDIQYLKKCGADAFLIGSSIMKSDNIVEQVRKLVNSI